VSEDDGTGQDPAGGRAPRSIEDFVGQLRGFTDRARGLAAGAVSGGFSLPKLPSPPGAMSAAQLRAIDGAVKGQRRQIQGMVAQLQAFDEQLAVFERVLDPLVEWSSTWARLEESVTELVRGTNPPAGPAPSGGAPAPAGEAPPVDDHPTPSPPH
jgi:hypothetical protein